MYMYSIFLACLQLWPIDVDLKFLEPIEKELKNLAKVIQFTLCGCKEN